MSTEFEVDAGDGTVLGGWVEGPVDGTPVLLLHGGPGDTDTLAGLGALLPRGCRAVRFDQRGAGRSPADGPFTIERSAADVEAVRVGLGLGRCVVVGHSWGANLALYHQWSHPGTASAVGYLCGTGLEWSRYKGRHEAEQRDRLGEVLASHLDALRADTDRSPADQAEYERLRLFTDMAPGMGAPMLADRLQREHRPGNRAANAALDAEAAALSLDVQVELCAGLDVPVVVVSAEHDPRPIAAVDSLLAALPAVEHVVIPEAGHVPWLENPAAVEASLAHLVDRAR